MKKLLLLLVCIISVHSISLGQVEKQIKGEALSADEKKKLEDSLQDIRQPAIGLLFLFFQDSGRCIFWIHFHVRRFHDYLHMQQHNLVRQEN